MISNVQVEGPWLRVYNQNRDRLSQMPCIQTTIVGVSSDFFVTQEGPWIITYDKHCKKIAQMLSKKIVVRGTTKQSFTLIEGGWMRMYDKQCNLVNEKRIYQRRIIKRLKLAI